MKLDSLLRAVSSTYRAEILKPESIDADAFEYTAIDVENTFITVKAYVTHTLLTVATYISSSQYGYNYLNPHQSSASNYDYYQMPNNFRSTQRLSSNTTSRSFTPSPKHQQESQLPPNCNPPKSSEQQNLFAYTSATVRTQQPQQSIPPVIPLSQIKTPPHQLIFCQWCNQTGHSARDCPFLKLGSESDSSVSKQPLINPSTSTLLYASLHINDVPLQILIDIGASATCINEKALSCLPHTRLLHQMPRSFLLADGFISLGVFGNVELSMAIATVRPFFIQIKKKKSCYFNLKYDG